jgi:hypothetical protein
VRAGGFRGTVFGVNPNHTEIEGFPCVPDMRRLPSPQRRALEVALLRAEPDGEQSLQRAVGLGLLGVLRTLASDAPTLLAIDDAQWLDHPSESALAFLARRLEDERVGVLCVRRGSGGDAPLGLDVALPAARFDRMALHGLEAGELELLLRSSLEVPLSRGDMITHEMVVNTYRVEAKV